LTRKARVSEPRLPAVSRAVRTIRRRPRFRRPRVILRFPAGRLRTARRFVVRYRVRTRFFAFFARSIRVATLAASESRKEATRRPFERRTRSSESFGRRRSPPEAPPPPGDPRRRGSVGRSGCSRRRSRPERGRTGCRGGTPRRHAPDRQQLDLLRLARPATEPQDPLWPVVVDLLREPVQGARACPRSWSARARPPSNTSAPKASASWWSFRW
jgi:hypothetical protein